ncbi:MAG TPA: nitroreductase family protein [Roseiflexaceae bacterium]|nr:nitroreductase family protein [Roseiflexaceae bacterium]
MEVFDAVRTMLAVRSYMETPVPQEVIRQIVEAGRLTGSARNAQPWHFIVIENRDTLRRIGALARSGPYVATAPLAIAIVIEKTPFAVSDASRAIEAMLLTAWSSGVGANWVGFVGGIDVIKPLLSIPDALDILAVLAFGYPAAAIGRGKKKRKLLGEVAHREQFGRPFDEV